MCFTILEATQRPLRSPLLTLFFFSFQIIAGYLLIFLDINPNIAKPYFKQ